MSRPMWRVYEVRSKSWSSPPNTISTCSTELRSPSSGCRRGCGRAAPRAGRAPSGASRPRRSTAWRCWNATRVRRQLLEAGDARARAPRPRTTSSVPVNSACGRPLDAAPDATSSSTTDACAPSPSSMNVRVRSARSGSPAAQRTTIGRSRRTPAGTSSTTPWSSAARVSWASLSSAGSGAAGRAAHGRVGSRVDELASGRASTPAARRLGERRDPRRRPSAIEAGRPRPRAAPARHSVRPRRRRRTRRRGRAVRRSM